MLTLYEEMFLLCLHEEKVVVLPAATAAFPYWFGAAILSDLALQKRIAIKDDHRIYLESAEPTGDRLLDETLHKIQAVSNPKKVGYWMDDFEFRPKKVFAQLLEQLRSKGVLKHEDEDYTWSVPYPADSTQAASAKFYLRNQLRGIFLANSEPNTREIALLSLLKACELLDQVFFKDERKQAARMIYEMLMSEALKDPFAQAGQEIENALAARVEED